MLVALSIILVGVIHFPVFPAAPYLEYDPADIPILIGSLVFGPLAGLALTLVASVIQGLTVSSGSGFPGILMHFIATGTFALVAGSIFKIGKNSLFAAIGIACGVLSMTAMMAAANLIITPLFLCAPVDAVKAILLPIIIPFNLIKAGVNGSIAFTVFLLTSKVFRYFKVT